MPRPANKSEARSKIQKELLESTNKPRFCFMGYAPPLCIGDDYEKPKASRTDTKPLLVPGPKTGTNPSSLFSFPPYVGDAYNSTKQKSVNPVSDRPKFKPPGRTPDPTKIEYISPFIETKTVARKSAEEDFETKKFLTTSASSPLFYPVIEYIGDVFNGAKKQAAEERIADKEKFKDAVPFKSGYGQTRLFGDFVDRTNDAVVVSSVELKRQVDAKNEVRNLIAFRPPGGPCPTAAYPEYIPCPPMEPKKKGKSLKPSWKSTCVPLLTSPCTSIVMKTCNLKR